jgi:hypothetical protein
MLKHKRVFVNIFVSRDVAQSGRAFALGAKGPRFESLYPDQFIYV